MITSEQKWVIGALGIAILSAVPSYFMQRPGVAAPAQSPLEKVESTGDAVPIAESDWTPRSMSGEEQQVLAETLKIDINHVDEKTLLDSKLPGVGPSTARDIIAYREAVGCFRDIDEIRNVKRLASDSKFNAIKDLIRVDLKGCEFRDGGEPGAAARPASKKSGRAARTGAQAGGDGPVNINKASVKELDALPGIGKTTAQRIVDYRNDYGSFGSIEDLLQVPGFKESTFEKIKDLITAN